LRAVIYCIFVLSVLLLLSFQNSPYAAAVNSVNIFPPASKPYGLSYEQHIENFWKWVTSLPVDKNPWKDQTGQNCNNGQSGTNSPVFYLSGNGGGTSVRICKMQSGKGLFIPISQVEISDKEAPNASIEDLHRLAKKDQDSVTSLYLKINDRVYNSQDLHNYRIHTPVFQVQFPKNAVFGVSEGVSKAVGDGYYLITEPLAKGTYTIQYKSSLICPGTDCLDPNFAEDIKYTIIAE
jgi:hypothetical protein